MNRLSNTVMAGMVLVALAAGAACNEMAPGRQAERRPAGTAETAPRGDDRITTSVQAQYYTDDTVRGREIDVRTEQSVVTLSGTVDNEAIRQRAVTIAQNVEGVARVDDRLQVAGQQAQAGQPQDPQPAGTAGHTAAETIQPAWITTQVQAQYFVNPEVRPWNIDVTTSQDGVVTLSGEVADARAHAEALRIARETAGVARVEDRVRVRGEAPGTKPEETAAAPAAAPDRPDDDWLTARIQATYFIDGWMKRRDIDVSTSDGVVTLRGSVASEAERRRAVELAGQIEGVRDVTDSLEVRPEAAREPGAALEPTREPAARPEGTPDPGVRPEGTREPTPRPEATPDPGARPEGAPEPEARGGGQ